MLLATWIIVMAIIIGAGIYAGKKITNDKEWSGGDKSLSALAVGCIFGAWQIGGISIIGAAQNGYTIGISGAWYSIATSIYFILIGIFAKLLRDNMPGDSVPDYLEKRFSSKSSRLYSYIWVVMAALYIPVQLKTIASVIQIVVPTFNTTGAMICGLVVAALYTSLGGMKGASVIGKITCFGIYILLVGFVLFTLPHFGGYSSLVSKLPQNFGSMFNMPKQRIVAWALGGIFSVSVMQSVLQPVLAAKNAKSAQIGSFLGYIIAGPICIFTAMIGMIGRAKTDALGNGVNAFAWTIHSLSSPTMAGIIFAVTTMIIAATMSTMMMATGTILTNIYKTDINKNATDKQKLNVSRYGTIIFSCLTLLVTFLIPSAQITTLFLTIVYVSTGPVSFSVFAGLIWKRTNATASFWSMLLGVITGIVWVSLGLVQKLDSLYPIVIVSYGVGIILTLLTSKKEDMPVSNKEDARA